MASLRAASSTQLVFLSFLKVFIVHELKIKEIRALPRSELRISEFMNPLSRAFFFQSVLFVHSHRSQDGRHTCWPEEDRTAREV